MRLHWVLLGTVVIVALTEGRASKPDHSGRHHPTPKPVPKGKVHVAARSRTVSKSVKAGRTIIKKGGSSATKSGPQAKNLHGRGIVVIPKSGNSNLTTTQATTERTTTLNISAIIERTTPPPKDLQHAKNSTTTQHYTTQATTTPKPRELKITENATKNQSTTLKPMVIKKIEAGANKTQPTTTPNSTDLRKTDDEIFSEAPKPHSLKIIDGDPKHEVTTSKPTNIKNIQAGAKHQVTTPKSKDLQSNEEDFPSDWATPEEVIIAKAPILNENDSDEDNDETATQAKTNVATTTKPHGTTTKTTTTTTTTGKPKYNIHPTYHAVHGISKNNTFPKPRSRKRKRMAKSRKRSAKHGKKRKGSKSTNNEVVPTKTKVDSSEVAKHLPLDTFNEISYNSDMKKAHVDTPSNIHKNLGKAIGLVSVAGLATGLAAGMGTAIKNHGNTEATTKVIPTEQFVAHKNPVANLASNIVKEKVLIKNAVYNVTVAKNNRTQNVEAEKNGNSITKTKEIAEEITLRPSSMEKTTPPTKISVEGATKDQTLNTFPSTKTEKIISENPKNDSPVTKSGQQDSPTVDTSSTTKTPTLTPGTQKPTILKQEVFEKVNHQNYVPFDKKSSLQVPKPESSPTTIEFPATKNEGVATTHVQTIQPTPSSSHDSNKELEKTLLTPEIQMAVHSLTNGFQATETPLAARNQATTASIPKDSHSGTAVPGKNTTAAYPFTAGTLLIREILNHGVNSGKDLAISAPLTVPGKIQKNDVQPTQKPINVSTTGKPATSGVSTQNILTQATTTAATSLKTTATSRTTMSLTPTPTKVPETSAKMVNETTPETTARPESTPTFVTALTEKLTGVNSMVTEKISQEF